MRLARGSMRLAFGNLYFETYIWSHVFGDLNSEIPVIMTLLWVLWVRVNLTPRNWYKANGKSKIRNPMRLFLFLDILEFLDLHHMWLICISCMWLFRLVRNFKLVWNFKRVPTLSSAMVLSVTFSFFVISFCYIQSVASSLCYFPSCKCFQN